MNWDRGLKRTRLVMSITGGLMVAVMILFTLRNEGLKMGLFIIAFGTVLSFGIIWGGMTAIMWVRRGFCEDKQKDGQKTNVSAPEDGIVETKHPKQKGGDYDN